MKFTYHLIRAACGYAAECVESEAVGEGKTPEQALESLRASLEEQMFRPNAVAPPPEAPPSAIELELANERPRDSLDLGGPGG